MKKLLLFFLPCFLLSGCYINQKIKYDTFDVPKNDLKTIPITVNIRELNDLRKDSELNSPLFEKQKQIMVNGERKCVNSEKHYKKEPVTLQISRLMTEHFYNMKLFEGLSYPYGSEKEYYLTGNLTNFFGQQDYSTAAALGAQFGLVGALATAKTTSPATIVIEVSDIQLFRSDGTLIKDLGSFKKVYNEELYVDAYCWCIYPNMNEKLKKFTTVLAEKISEDLQAIVFE